jgi:hypothetical protein
MTGILGVLGGLIVLRKVGPGPGAAAQARPVAAEAEDG